MPDGNQQQLSFNRAVWVHVWNEFRGGWPSRKEAAGEGIVVAGLTFAVAHFLGATDEAVAARIALIVGVLCIFLRPFGLALFGWITAPRHLYYTQRDALSAAADVVERVQNEELRARLERIRAELIKHCDKAPDRSHSDPNTEHDWMNHADALLGRTVKIEVRRKLQRFTGGRSDHTGLLNGVASLRTIAAKLTLDDLS
jgi:hypothetical protein